MASPKQRTPPWRKPAQRFQDVPKTRADLRSCWHSLLDMQAQNSLSGLLDPAWPWLVLLTWAETLSECMRVSTCIVLRRLKPRSKAAVRSAGSPGASSREHTLYLCWLWWVCSCTMPKSYSCQAAACQAQLGVCEHTTAAVPIPGLGI